MALISAPDDTWGISGPTFLVIYLAAALVFLVVALVLRMSATHAGPDHVVRRAGRAEIAHLAGGSPQAMYASVAGLRAVGAVGVATQGVLAQTGPPPGDMNRLDHAVYDAAGRGVRVADLSADLPVRSALDELTTTVERAGWLLSDDARAKARLGGLLLLALTGLGIVRTMAGFANERPVLLLALCGLATLTIGLLLTRAPRLTALGSAALAEAKAGNRHLAPSQSPSWATYGMAGAAMGVAIYGTSALWAADPAFAAEAGIRRETTGSGDGGTTGGDGGGGDGGGGGGDGGGGGCGGGCGG